MLFIITTTAIFYLLGSVPASLVLARLRGLTDPRLAGSGNAGATNMLRLHGRRAGLVVLLMDMGKAWLGLWLAGRLVPEQPPFSPYCLQWMWLTALVAGHIFPLFYRFKGGKGMAPFIGGVLLLQPVMALLVFLMVLPLLAWNRRGSVTSLSALLLYVPLGLTQVPVEHLQCQWYGALATGSLILLAHHANLTRLIRGEEQPLA